MGQYWKPVNLDKKEFLHAHALGDGLKLCEIAFSSNGVAAALVMLLAPLPERRGGGDPESHPLLGRWAGDRIVMVGDYSESADFPGCPVDFGALYDSADYTDISALARDFLARESK